MKNKRFSLPWRQIHLDFHTGPAIDDVGRDFDAKEFARVFKEAHVNSVTLFAKCHHGHLYYNTQRPERHPGLKKGLNLLGEQIEALHSVGIRAPIYLSVQCDEYAANMHPEWIAKNPDGTLVGRKPLSGDPFSWQILEMSSPYQDYLAEQTAEVLKLFKPVDGIFYDMCWDQPSVSQWACAGMAKANLNPQKEEDRARYAHDVALGYMKRFYKQVKNAQASATIHFNSRPLSNLAEEIDFLAQVEIEALPTGGWGYMYFPKNVRFARNFGKPYLGMTARFHKSWADFGGLKPYPALEYETSQMMAHGARCSIGDQLHPRGTTDAGAYALIGEIYDRVEQREPWLEGAVPVTQVGVMQVSSGTYFGAGGTEEGATRMLTQLKQQFDIILPDAKLEKYELVVLPDRIQIDAAMAARLKSYIQQGGAVLASGISGLSEDGSKLLMPQWGIKPEGYSAFTTTYLRFGKQIGQDVPDSNHVMYEKGLLVKPAKGTQVLAKVVDPYFERAWNHFSSHNQTPDDRLTQYAAATIKGKVGYIAYPIFSAFANHGSAMYRLLVRNMLELLLPEPLLRVDAPTSTEATVMRQSNRTIVHLLQYCPERRAGTLDLVEDIVPLYDVPLSLKLAKAPKKVYLAPEQEAVEFEYMHGRVNLLVPEIVGHAMVVME